MPAGPISGLAETVVGLTVSFTIEFAHFLSTRKKYWLVPIFLIMTLFGGLLVLSHGTAISPLMYALF